MKNNMFRKKLSNSKVDTVTSKKWMSNSAYSNLYPRSRKLVVSVYYQAHGASPTLSYLLVMAPARSRIAGFAGFTFFGELA